MTKLTRETMTTQPKFHPVVEAVARAMEAKYGGDPWENFTGDAEFFIRAFLDATREPSDGMIRNFTAVMHWPAMLYQLRKEIFGE